MNQLTDKQMKEVIKAVLFVSGEGIELFEFAERFERSLDEIKNLIKDMQTELCGENGLHLITYANKAQLSTNPQLNEQVSSVLNPIREKALTKAAMQTLGIIAYKQPITRLEIESIRGVSADYAVQVLLDNNMIEVVGRKDVVGKPLLFGTTETFLKRFDLENLDSLPDYDELLEQIQLIRSENEIKISESLYKDHTIDDESLFIQSEFDALTPEEKKQKQEDEEMLAQRLKNIDKVIKGAKQNTDNILEGKKEPEEELSDVELNDMFKKVMEGAENKDNSAQDNKLA
jgi:segregation and condensation protein B